MHNRTTPKALVAALALAAVAACSSAEDGPAAGAQDVTTGAGGLTPYGNDRIGAMLKDHPELVPRTFQDFEKLFKVGRQCARTDAKEIFVVQEAQTRDTGENKGTSRRLPRAVVTGCTTSQDPVDPVKPSFSLMAALVSADAPTTDNMALRRVESVAFDETTGEFNFYAFDDQGEGKPGTVTRTLRDGKGAVTAIRLVPGETAQEIPVPFNCFGCHVNGGPIMNELTQPWTNWVSFVNPLPSIEMSGETLSIVQAAQTASDLETIIEHAVSIGVEGTSPDSGFGARTLAGTAPGGLALLMKSVFCQTELAFKSGHPSSGVPIELFVDPHATADAQLVAPPVEPTDVFPFQLPVRSPHDQEIETFLQIRGFLTPNTVAAVRLLDDQNDIFSDARCGLLDAVTAGLPTAPADVDAHVRAVVAKQLDAGTFATISPERKSYIAQLLKTQDGDPSLQPLHDAYIKEVTARYQTLVAQMQSPDARKGLKALEAARKSRANDMFEDGGPLPILTATP
jgi:hypothetical protein